MHNIWLQQSKKRGAYLYTTTFDDLIFEFSSKQHCITISRRVVHWIKGLIKLNFFCVNKPNLMTKSNLQTQFWNTHWAHFSQLKSHTWKGTRSLAFVKESQTCFKNHKGIHISRIVSNFLAHMSTPKHEDCMWKLNNPPLELISMRLWISSMGVLRSWKFRVEMECGI
jgi:hypothetical protein